MKQIAAALVTALAFVAPPALAQQLSLEELRAKVDQEMSKDDEIIAMLSSEDPARSQATMRVMLDSGDPEMTRIALENGIHSTDAVVRTLAVKGFLASEPLIEMHIDASDEDQNELSYVLGDLQVAANADQQAVWIGQLEEGAADGTCYPAERWPGDCLFRAVGGTLQIFGTDKRWHDLYLTDAGSLQSSMVLSRANTAIRVTATIPVR
ncbi:hypothetical protein [Salipiger bermudensis]|uniref:hypothetical protein n=1 Tax=Salipiger bermudensis TaxID=344736 RepID=UPI003008C385